ncbi:PfkB family carbohydrate kinase [Thiothrix subterranea]|uniref:PfkB family carbohydrate kinase n=1 Tax=Thiothrix subterranea TaxID=2735563 RepID=UPI00280A6325|nr:PfkB family carbohydrate kinase [Thiothrix subterranea]
MFIVCGEALFDVFVPEGVSQAAFAVPFAARAGGSPFNVAIGLRRLGQPVALLTGVSTDFLGERLMAVLQAEQVSVELIARKSAQPPWVLSRKMRWACLAMRFTAQVLRIAC